METLVKTSVCVLLLSFLIGSSLPQETSTDTPAPRPKATIPPAWLRELVKKVPQSNTTWPTEIDQTLDQNQDTNLDPNHDQNMDQTLDQTGDEGAVESSNDYSGIPSGFMFITEEDNVGEPTQAPTFPNETMVRAEDQDYNLTTTSLPPKTDTNMIDGETENSTATNQNNTGNETPQNTTGVYNKTEMTTPMTTPMTTLTPEISQTTAPDSGLANDTENNGTVTSGAIPVEHGEDTTPTAGPPINTTTERTSRLPLTTTPVPASPDHLNLSDKGAGPVGTAERGFSDSHQRRKDAWAAILGTFVAVAMVGLVAYIILKKKHHKAFSHRKLEEDPPSDPVLRLDNTEPLDLNFGRAAYYNPTLQSDHIQMSHFNKN